MSLIKTNIRFLLRKTFIDVFFFRKIDIFIGALEENLITNKHLVASHPYHHDHITWCVQKRKPIPVWKNVFYLCNNPLLYLILTLESVTVLIGGYIFQMFEPRQKWDYNKFIIEGFRCMLGFPCSFSPETCTIPSGYIFMLFAGIINAVVMNVALILLTTNPVLNLQIQSIQEIIDGSFTLMVDGFAFKQILGQNKVNPFYLKCKIISIYLVNHFHTDISFWIIGPIESGRESRSLF